MDFKSIGMNWYVSLREKLETVCIEVEDKVQETKIVERVQTGCLQVNKCFAELKQELFPSSCTPPVQEKVSDSSALEKADTNDVNGSHEELGDIPTTGKDSSPSSSLSEDGDICDSLRPSSVNSTRCVDCVNTLEENDVTDILEPTTEGTSSVMNEKQAPCQSLEKADTNDTKSCHKESGGLCKDSCPLSNSFQDGNLHGCIPPYSANSVACLDSMKSLEGNIAANVSEPITEDISSVNNERQAPCSSEEVSSSRSEVALRSGPQRTTHLDPVLSALNDMSASSFFSELANTDNNEASILSLLTMQQTGSPEVTSDESCSHCEVDGDVVHGTTHGPDVVCSLSTSCKDPPVTGTDSMEVTGHNSCPQSRLVCENTVNALGYGSDVSNPLSTSDMDSPFIPDENLVCGFIPSKSIPSTETKDNDMVSDVTGSSYPNSVKSSMEDIEQFDNVQLGNSCIVIDDKDLQIDPRPNKRRSLKKKLQSAFGMRSRKQREYEQLAILYSDIDADIKLSRDISLPAKDLHLMKSAHELSEPDGWELV